jgi:anion-transporting  ArsA/GET3 family ATPase
MGKGGVGKTTLTAALALNRAREGKRVLVAEVGGASRFSALFGHTGSYTPTQVVEGIHAITLTPQEAIEDFVVLRLKLRSIYHLVFGNRVMRPFLAAVPGLHDLIQLGKLFFEEARTEPDGSFVWDQILLDAPATGHGVTMLHAPRSMMELTGAGPFHENARLVHDLFADRERTSLVVASLPEELVVNETLDLVNRLEGLADGLALCVLNKVQPIRESPQAIESVRPFLAGRGLDEALALAWSEATRGEMQELSHTRLVEGLGCPVVELPLLEVRDLGLAELHRLAACLESRT